MWYIAVTGLLYCDQGGRPVAISMIVQPTLQTSALRQEFWGPVDLMTSGAIHNGVPLAWPPVAWSVLPETSLVRLDAPKSASFTMPSCDSNALAAFTSLCAMPFAWRYSNPNKICLAYNRTTLSSSLPNLSNNERRDPPETYSRKMASVSDRESTPRYRTMFGWPRFFRVRTSFSRACLSLEETSSASSIFTAMSSPVSKFSPRYTVPKAPFPTNSPRCHRIRRSVGWGATFALLGLRSGGWLSSLRLSAKEPSSTMDVARGRCSSGSNRRSLMGDTCLRGVTCVSASVCGGSGDAGALKGSKTRSRACGVGDEIRACNLLGVTGLVGGGETSRDAVTTSSSSSRAADRASVKGDTRPLSGRSKSSSYTRSSSSFMTRTFCEFVEENPSNSSFRSFCEARVIKSPSAS
mmetsp:Transcript_21035/g.54856  ORF Transcript_21035/g.54856 Transcript_21035/m.54856 type:complete len:408 (+) Transcript_21035:2505-3728(+)